MVERKKRDWSACVGRVRRRLRRNEALRRLAIGGLASAAILLLLLATRAAGLPDAGPLTFIVLVPLAFSIVHASRTGVSVTEAAIFLDRRIGREDAVSSALTALPGPFSVSLGAAADSQCGSVDAARLTRFRPSMAAKAIPVILVLCLSVEVASGGVGGGARGATLPDGPGGELVAARAGARALIAAADRDPGNIPDLPSRLREALGDLEKARAIYIDVREELMGRTAVRMAVEEGRIRTADLAPEEARSLAEALHDASARLPSQGRAASLARAAREALREGSDEDLGEALRALSDLLRAGGEDGIDEVASEIRRIGVRRGIPLPPPDPGRPVAEIEPLPVTPGPGGTLERAMDREDVPWEYRETVRRYFERKGGESR